MPTISEALQDLSWGPRYPRRPVRFPSGDAEGRESATQKSASGAETQCSPMLYKLARGQPLWRQTPPPANLAAWLSTSLPPETPRPPQTFPARPATAYNNEAQLNVHWLLMCESCVGFIQSVLPLPQGRCLEAQLQGASANGNRDATTDVHVALIGSAPPVRRDVGVLPQTCEPESIAIVEVKKEPALEGNSLVDLEFLLTAEDLQWPVPFDPEHRGGVSAGQRLWLQVYHQLLVYGVTAGIVAGDNTIFLVERATEVVADDLTGTLNKIGKLVVEGPLYMYPGAGQESFTPAMLYTYLAWATLARLD
ncbi:hypothetical protein VTO73DRAFT_10256 [Trametes versicolor]